LVVILTIDCAVSVVVFTDSASVVVFTNSASVVVLAIARVFSVVGLAINGKADPP
jgi:hypothetical protein